MLKVDEWRYGAKVAGLQVEESNRIAPFGGFLGYPMISLERAAPVVKAAAISTMGYQARSRIILAASAFSLLVSAISMTVAQV